MMLLCLTMESTISTALHKGLPDPMAYVCYSSPSSVYVLYSGVLLPRLAGCGVGTMNAVCRRVEFAWLRAASCWLGFSDLYCRNDERAINFF